MKDIFLNDELSQIKRFKGRFKYELFVHQREFRAIAESLDYTYPKEAFDGVIQFKKKLLSPSLAYAKMIQAFYLFVGRQIQADVPESLVQAELDQCLHLGLKAVGGELPSDKEEAVQVLDQAYEAVTDRLTAALS